VKKPGQSGKNRHAPVFNPFGPFYLIVLIMCYYFIILINSNLFFNNSEEWPRIFRLSNNYTKGRFWNTGDNRWEGWSFNCIRWSRPG